MNKVKLFSEINQNMKKLFGNKLQQIFLFGSYARNEQDSESDIDFFVLVNDTEENLEKFKYKISDIMNKLTLNFNILVSITEETTERFSKYLEVLPFYKNVKNEGIIIYG